MGIFTMKLDIEKSIIIDASKEKVWGYLSDSKKKSQWSPWFVLERDCKQNISGNPDEIGYSEYWSGKYIWEWEEILEEIKKYSLRKYALNFMRPFKSKNTESFRLEEISENKTKIIWKMQATLPVFMFVMKKMVTHFIWSDFERGLTMLKDLIETGKIETSTIYNWEENFPKTYFLWLKSKGSTQEIAKNMNWEFMWLYKYAQEKNVSPTISFTKYTKSDSLYKNFEYTASLALSEEDYTKLLWEDLGKYFVWILNETKISKTTHLWSYKYIANSWTGAYMYVRWEKLKENKKEWPLEIYEKWPVHEVKEKDYITHILVPVK